MNVNKTIKILALSGFLIIISTGLFAESIKLSTYYPAPFGAYDRLKLVPRDTLSLDPHCDDPHDLGTMYYDNGSKEMTEGIYACLKVSKTEYNWIPMSKPLSTVVNSSIVGNSKVVCVTKDNTFGVCMNNPSYDGTCACK